MITRFLAVLIALAMTYSSSTAFAKPAQSSGSMWTGNLEIDGSMGIGTGPGDFDSAAGMNFGAGYMLSSINKNLQVRVDLSYYNFGFAQLGYDLDYRRIPLTVSGRYYFPVNDKMKAFAQAGIETSFDYFEYADALGKHKKNEVNLGLSPGGGVELMVAQNVSIFVVGRYHLVSDSYVSMQFGAGFHF